MRTILLLLLSLRCAYAQPDFDLLLATQHPVAGTSIDRTGLLVEFVMDSGAGYTLTNTAAAHDPYITNNLFPAPDNHFSNTVVSYFNGYNGSIAHRYTNDPNGNPTNAIRWTATGVNQRIIKNITTDGGQYTYSVWLKSNQATNQQVAIGMFGGGGVVVSSTFEVSTNWERFSTTQTPSVASIFLALVHTGTNGQAVDVSLYGPQLEKAASPTDYVGMDTNWHANLGDLRATGITSAPIWTNYGLYFPVGGSRWAGGFGKASISNVSVYSMFRSPTNSVRQYQYLVSDIFTVGKLRLGTRFGSRIPGFTFNGTTVVSPSIWSDGFWHIATGVYDGFGVHLYLDGASVAYQPIPAKSVMEITDLQIGNVNSTLIMYEGDIGYTSIYTNVHDSVKVGSIVDSIAASTASRITYFKVPYYVIAEGDSRTIDASSYARQGITNLIGSNIAMRVFATNGTTFTMLTNRAASVDSSFITWGTNLLSVLVGVVDNSSDQTNAFNLLKNYCLDRRSTAIANGKTLRIIACTELPATEATRPGWLAKRVILNSLIASDNTWYDALCDLGGDPTVGTDAACSNVTYYADGLHPTAAAHTILSTNYAATLRTLIQ